MRLGVKMAKAKKIETYRDKYFSTVVYEYRGRRYEVEYANAWTCCVTPAWVQHRDKQAEIDNILDNPVAASSGGESFTEQLDQVWGIMGW